MKRPLAHHDLPKWMHYLVPTTHAQSKLPIATISHSASQSLPFRSGEQYSCFYWSAPVHHKYCSVSVSASSKFSHQSSSCSSESDTFYSIDSLFCFCCLKNRPFVENSIHSSVFNGNKKMEHQTHRAYCS